MCDWVPGCYYLIRREVLTKSGCLILAIFNYEEVDHCFAAKKAGWEVIFYPDTTVVHIGGESAKTVGKSPRAGANSRIFRSKASCFFTEKIMAFSPW